MKVKRRGLPATPFEDLLSPVMGNAGPRLGHPLFGLPGMPRLQQTGAEHLALDRDALLNAQGRKRGVQAGCLHLRR